MKLNDSLKNINTYPFHMPGHKRNPKFDILGTDIDITEINGFDNLHNPNGIIKDVEEKLCQLYTAKRSFMLVNGSTVGILSAIFAVCNEGDLVIVARNCHKSVYNACMIRKLKILYIEPEYDETHGFYKAVKQKTINDAISQHKNAKCVIITSPSYEGYISDIDCSIPLIIDAAHGAHLGFGNFPKYPKADIVISSLHKTLPALTQSAVANIYNTEYINKFKLYLDIFEASSPSYLIMNSVGKCIDYIVKNEEDFDSLIKSTKEIHNLNLNNLKIIENDDVSKIIISTAYTNITGIILAKILRNDYQIEVELSSEKYIILICTIGDEEYAFQKLKNALTDIDNKIEKVKPKPVIKPNITKEICEIHVGDSEKRSIKKSLNKISNEFIYAYPPDIPILCPNEIITEEIIEYIENAINKGINIISDSGLLPNIILTKK